MFCGGLLLRCGRENWFTKALKGVCPRGFVLLKGLGVGESVSAKEEAEEEGCIEGERRVVFVSIGMRLVPC